MATVDKGSPHDRTMALVKAFVLSVLISATLAKLGEAAFDNYWLTVHSNDEVRPIDAFVRVLDQDNISVFLFVGYFLLVLVRHVGALYSTETVLNTDLAQLWSTSKRAKAVIVLDFVLTFIMFMLHYAVAYGLSEAIDTSADSSKIALRGWTLAVAPPLLAALMVDASLCALALYAASFSTKQDENSNGAELWRLNCIWLACTALEMFLIVVACYLVSTALVATPAVLFAIAVATADIYLSREYWSQIIALSSPDLSDRQ